MGASKVINPSLSPKKETETETQASTAIPLSLYFAADINNDNIYMCVSYLRRSGLVGKNNHSRPTVVFLMGASKGVIDNPFA